MDEIKDPKAVLEALERAKEDAKKFREQLKESQNNLARLEAERDDLKANVESLTTDNPWKLKYKDIFVRSLLPVTESDRVMKYIDMESITFDEDDNLVGAQEAIAKVKEDLPEIFDRKRRIGAEADIWAQGDPPKEMSGSEMQVARLYRNKS